MPSLAVYDGSGCGYSRPQKATTTAGHGIGRGQPGLSPAQPCSAAVARYLRRSKNVCKIVAAEQLTYEANIQPEQRINSELDEIYEMFATACSSFAS